MLRFSSLTRALAVLFVTFLVLTIIVNILMSHLLRSGDINRLQELVNQYSLKIAYYVALIMTNPLGLTQITRGLVPPIESVSAYLVIVLTLLFIFTSMLLAGVEDLRGSLQLIRVNRVTGMPLLGSAMLMIGGSALAIGGLVTPLFANVKPIVTSSVRLTLSSGMAILTLPLPWTMVLGYELWLVGVVVLGIVVTATLLLGLRQGGFTGRGALSTIGALLLMGGSVYAFVNPLFGFLIATVGSAVLSLVGVGP
ncbi:MAG: hypothetical protein RXN91_09335 [Caldivirga sp.]